MATSKHRQQRRTGYVESLEARVFFSTYTVTNLHDSGLGSVRADIQMANASPGADTITFAAGLTGLINLTSGQLEISDDLTITGPGSASITISGVNQSRVFQVDAGKTAFISGVTITSGHAPAGGPLAVGGDGGGIYSLGSITFSGCQVSDSAAGVGGIDADGGLGGGIYAAGPATLVNCAITDNSAGIGGISGGVQGNGGGIYAAGPLSMANCTVTGNGGYIGGGIDATNSARLTNVTISKNIAQTTGGGIAAIGDVVVENSNVAGNLTHLYAFPTKPDDVWGAVDLTLAGCTVGSLSSLGKLSAANCAVTTLNLSGNSMLNDCTISGSQGNAITNQGTLMLVGCTLTGNSATSNGNPGSALVNSGSATLNGCTVTSNRLLVGGVILNATGGMLSLTDCTISNNDGSTAATFKSDGGGIENQGTLAMLGCTVAGNTTTVTAGQSPVEVGGGIANAGNASLVDCTIGGNSVSTGTASGASIAGGGIENSGNLRLTNCTVAGNTVNADGSAGNDSVGGGIYSSAGHVFLSNTMVASNHVVDPNGVFSPDIGGAIDPSSAYNLIGDGNGMTGMTTANRNQIGTAAMPIDPKLAPLGDYGGPTQTMPPLPGSPAIDAGSNALAVGPDGKPLPTDQRGYYRIFNHTVDIGAVEYGSLPLLPGDANADGKVDFTDLVLAARKYGMTGAAWADGDFNADGSVGFDDLVIVARNYGKSVSLSSAAATNATTPATTFYVQPADELPRLARGTRHRH